MNAASPRTRRVTQRAALLPADGRQHNLSLVLQELYTNGAQSRADLARSVGLTKVTVSDLVAELVDAGRVVELGPSTAVRPGKPAILVDINRRGLLTAALDLAPHEGLRGALLDLDGNVIARASRDLADGNGEVVLASVLDLAREVVAAADAPLLGMGVGTPGLVGPDGIVERAPNLGWTDVPLGAVLASENGLPVLVVNDADAAVHAESTFGGGGDDTLLVRIGQGVGCGLIVGGVRVHGAHFAAGEIGHVTVGTDGGVACRCGKVGCLETWTSVPNLRKAIAERGGDVPLREAGERLGIALAPVVAALDLSDVVLSGPTDLLSGSLLETFDATLRGRLLARPHTGLAVRLAAGPDDIILRGAAALVLWDQLGVA